MPTYDYICDACGHEFEAFESMMVDPQTVCPTCKEIKLRRKIGPGAAILFKGSGFYQTDYRSESYKAGKKADSNSSAPPASSSTTPTTPASAPSAAPKAESTPKPSSGTS